MTVTDGRFFFEEMVVPADVRLVFVGSSPPQFFVRGRLQIDGAIDIAGESRPFSELVTGTEAGDRGGEGAVFAGDGGQGGDRCQGNGAQPTNDGRDGGNCRVLANHAFAGQLGSTAGRGSKLFPASGLDSAITAGYPPIAPPVTHAYCMQAPAGGGGGGSFAAGQNGRVITNPVLDPTTGSPPRLSFMGPEAPAGEALPLLPVPGGTPSSVHLLVGGAGGGGGASSAAFQLHFLTTNIWSPGSGGGGGGGAILLSAGHLLRIGDDASVSARGGSAGVSSSSAISGLPFATAQPEEPRSRSWLKKPEVEETLSKKKQIKIPMRIM